MLAIKVEHPEEVHQESKYDSQPIAEGDQSSTKPVSKDIETQEFCVLHQMLLFQLFDSLYSAQIVSQGVHKPSSPPEVGV
ncbi:hypothetical protein C8R44DRAFT_762290 [Mycena epipterygia]|nr:hypothetical protein C8R44DRAFT_762290 [Mycena epipterygia]